MDKHEYIEEHSDLLSHINSGIDAYFNNFDSFLGNLCLSGKKILDIGCGIGFYISRLEKAGCSNIIGIDINPYCLKHAHQRIKTKNLILASAENIPFRSNKFDMVYLIDVIEHLQYPELALSETHRILKREGKLILITPNSWRLNKLFRGFGFSCKFHTREFNMIELRRALKRCDFTIIKATSCSIPPLRNKLNNLYKYLDQLSPWNYIISIFGGAWWIVAEKK